MGRVEETAGVADDEVRLHAAHGNSRSGVHVIPMALAGVRCLVVEDVDIVARSEARLLEGFGALVSIATTLASAISHLRRQTWDLVIVDLVLPDGDGERALRLARELSPCAGLVVASGTLTHSRAIGLQRMGAIVLDKDGAAACLIEASIAALGRAGESLRNALSAQAAGTIAPDLAASGGLAVLTQFAGAFAPDITAVSRDRADLDQVLAAARCLVIEGDASVGRAVCRALEERGASVIGVATVADAQRSFSMEPPDLVVTEDRFRDGNAESVMRFACARRPPLGLVVVSGSFDAFRPPKLRARGAVVIDKRADLAVLCRAAHAALVGARAPGSERAAELARGLPAKTEIERAVAAFVTTFKLSPQQAFMVGCLTAGLSNKGIAAACGATADSIRMQWGRILEKLGVAGDSKSREEVFAVLTRYCAGERY